MWTRALAHLPAPLLLAPLFLQVPTSEEPLNQIFWSGMVLGPLALLTSLGLLAGFAAGLVDGAALSRTALVAALWLFPLSLALPVLPVVVYALLGLALYAAGRAPGQRARQLPDVRAAGAVWQALRLPPSSPSRIALAASWAPWWWLAIVLAAVIAILGLIGAASSVMGLGPSGGGPAAAVAAFPFLIGGLVLWAGAAALAGPAMLLLACILAAVPVARIVHVAAVSTQRRRASVAVQALVELLPLLLPLLLWRHSALLAVAAGLFGTAVAALHATAVLRRGPSWRAVALSLYLPLARPVVLVRALLLRLLTLALPALVGWLSLAMASLLLSPVALLVAACVHGALFAAGYSGTPALAAHGIAAALQILAFLAAAGFFAGLPLHRHSVAAATYWPAFLAEEDDHFGRLLSVAAEGVRAATEGRGTGLQRTP